MGLKSQNKKIEPKTRGKQNRNQNKTETKMTLKTKLKKNHLNERPQISGFFLGAWNKLKLLP